MTIRDLLDQGITIQGNVIIKSWLNDDSPCTYYEGNAENIKQNKKYIDKEITYIYPINMVDSIPGVCIEVKENDE